MMRFGDVAVSATDAKASATGWKEKLGFESMVLDAEGKGHALIAAPPGERFLLHLCEGFEAPRASGVRSVEDGSEKSERASRRRSYMGARARPRMTRRALVTGANRGLGLETARRLVQLGHEVFVGARDGEAGAEAAAAIGARFVLVDVTDPASIERAAREVGALDVLVNNAAVALDEDDTSLAAPDGLVLATMDTNLLGAWRLSRAFVPGMVARGWGRVVNVSSGAGSLAELGGYAPAYSVSKAALNAFTRYLAQELDGTGVKVNAVCPGWVRTEMGGASAPRSVEQGAGGIVWAATLPDDGPTNGFFRDGRPAAW